MKFAANCRENGRTAFKQPAGLHHRTLFQLVATPVQNKTGALLKQLTSVFTFMALASSAPAAVWYVDSSVASSGDGTSWTTAWKNVSNIGGLSAGDTVYFSGGPSGSSQTYSVTSNWSPRGGSSGNPIVYETGQDANHNGTVIFNGNRTWDYFTPASYVTFNGNVSGARHMVFTNANAATTSNFSVLMSETSSTMYNQVFRYVDFTGAVYITPCNGTEFDHCKFEANNWNNRDIFLQGDGSQSSATEGFIHDCEIWVVADSGTTYTGDDGLAGGNITVSNCFFGTVPIPANSYIGQAQQHQDLIQGAYGQIHVLNTWFQGSHQYGFYGEYAYQGGSYWVINCVFVNIKVFAVAIGPDSPNYTLPNNIVANNLCIDGGGLGVNNGASYSGINYSGSIVANNISVNTTSTDLSGSGLSVVKNVTSFPTSGFVSYSQSLDTSGQGTNNNFHLNATATTAIGQGTNLTPNFTFDRDGNSRPATGAWDIGPYMYGSASTNPILSVLPSTTVNFGSVLTNTTVYFTNTVQNSGVGLLVGTAAISVPLLSPFNILSGAVFTLGAGQSTNLIVSFSPGSVGSFNNSIIYTVVGGTGATGALSGSGVASYTAPQVSAISQSGSDVDTVAAGLQVYPRYIESYSGSASDPSGLPLTWQWIYTVNGGAETVLQSGAGAVTSISYTYPTGTANSTYVWKLRVSNGYSTSESDLTVGVEGPKTVSGTLNFPPSAANISAPFVLSSGYVSQSSTTGTNGGQLIYYFTTTNTSIIAVEAMVYAPNDGANSFYVNIDAPPTDPTNIWDLPITTGFTNDIVTWRGNGTNDQMSIYPQQNFSLNAGLHQLIIKGREAGAELGPITIVQVQPPPQPPFVVQ